MKTRAQLRDAVRRTYLGITPPVDRGGAEGAAPQERPDPSNAVLNDCLNWAVSDINTECDLGFSFAATIAISAQDTDFRGAFWIDTLELDVHNVKRAAWKGSSDTEYRRLTPDSWGQMDRPESRYGRYDATAPGTPGRLLMEGTKIGVFPAPSAEGVLALVTGTGATKLLTDSDVIDFLPSEYHEGVELGAAIAFWRSRAHNAEMQAKLAVYLPIYEGQSEGAWKYKIKVWKSRRNEGHTPGAVPATRRRYVRGYRIS